MVENSIKRNYLDYILTDILPVELPESFSFYPFYNYLIDNHKKVDKLLDTIIKLKNDSNQNLENNGGTLFENNKWASMPLKFRIAKTDNSSREINISQPFAALEIFLFVATYEKELLNILSNTSMFSIRYHVKNNDLYYKQKRKNIINYFSNLANDLDKSVIQQTGMYFKIEPYRSIADFTNSDKWYDLNMKYKYFAKLDYKSCFDSIYTHAFVWLIAKDVNDSISFKNGNIFTTIDRILQNINARTSNGIIVGPEFSRMIAEILLQGIDSTVYNTLLDENVYFEKNYCICRYVDDLFIFSESEGLLDKIIKCYDINANKYKLRLNESKIIKEKLPFVLNPWLQKVNEYATELSNSIFYSKEERENLENNVHLIKSRLLYTKKSSLKRNFNNLLCSYESDKKTLVSYILGTMLNKISSPCGKYHIFSETTSNNTFYDFLDYLFFIFSHFPSYENTQKLISIISYINDEIDFQVNKNSILQQIISRYSYLFAFANISDVVNLILLCAKCNIEIPYQYELTIVEKIRGENNPILWATYLIYSKYNKNYFDGILREVEKNIIGAMNSIIKKKNVLTYREIWWLLIFNKCPYVNINIQNTFNEIIQNDIMKRCSDSENPCDDCVEIVSKFLLTNDKQFFEWEITQNDLLKQITYRTYKRTVFRNYRYGRVEYTSV